MGYRGRKRPKIPVKSLTEALILRQDKIYRANSIRYIVADNVDYHSSCISGMTLKIYNPNDKYNSININVLHIANYATLGIGFALIS